MDIPNHHEHPELWFRPSPVLPFPVLFPLFEKEKITATFRLGKRDHMHPKGYIPGTEAAVHLYDDAWQEKLRTNVRVEKVVSKSLNAFVKAELEDTAYHSIESVQQDLSFFEKRPIASDEMISLVIFSYLNHREQPMNIETLVQKGIARIAELPPNNWREIGGDAPLTIPLIAEEYPAKTAVMWNAAYTKFDMPDRNMMVVADSKNVARIVETFRADPRYRGGGAGVGFKEVILPHLDEVTPLAKAMGAVNIIKKDVRGRLLGDNTDGEGYAQSLEQALVKGSKSLKGARVLILGAGGSGRAIAFALANKGAQLTILNRTESKARELASTLNDYFKNAVAFGGGRILLPSVLDKADAIVSVIDDAVSPLDAYSTLGDMALPVTEESIVRNYETTERLLADLDRRVVISDIRIRKEPTTMLSQAKALGFHTLDGIPMVVNQGVAAFWWLYHAQLTPLGVSQADVEQVMREAAGL